jgi:hypothetical protein
MIKEFKEDIASMYSLMERMDKHMTTSQAEYNKENYLDEAISTGSGKLEPNVLMTIDEDNSNRTRVLKVWVGPLFPQDWKKMTSIYDCKHLNYNGMDGVIFKKSLPYKKDARKKNNTTVQSNPTTDTTATLTASTPQATPQAVPAKGLLAKLRAKQAVNEGLLSKLKANQQGTATQTAPVSNPTAATTSASQASPQTAPNTNGVDDSIVTWFEKIFIPAIKSVAKNPNYEQGHIANLMDISYLTDKFLVAPEKTDANYTEESFEQIKTSVADAIKNGDWGSIANIFTPVNLQAIIFGNVLTGRNQAMVSHQARDFGLNVGDPDYPTNLYAGGKWLKKFGRRVLPNAKYKYFTISPRMNDKGTSVNFGSKGHYDEFGTQLKGFQPAYLYNITDTERVPAAEWDDYVQKGLIPKKMDPNVDYFTDQAGLANNLTGELNSVATAERDAVLAAQQASLSSEQQQLLNDIQTDDGKAKIFNDALLEYAESYNYTGTPLVDVRNSSNIMHDYANNIIAFCGFLLIKLRYNNPTFVAPMKMISAFAIGCKTVGANEILSQFNSQIPHDSQISTKAQMLEAWDNACKVTLQAVTNTVNAMVEYLSNKYAKFRDDVQQAQAAPVAVVANGSTTTPVNENKDSRSIEDLLEEFMK